MDNSVAGVLDYINYSTDTELQEYLNRMNGKAHQMKQSSDHWFEITLLFRKQ